MDMFNRIKSAVSSALPGNPLQRDFDTHSQIASGGPGLLWKIYSGVKRTTKQEASIFVLEKKVLERYSRGDREKILESLRRGVSQLTRLRHPKILSVLQPLEESREFLAFATEPVFASLSNVLGNQENISPIPKELQDYKLFEVEIRHGLLQVIEGIAFLHNDAKIMHHNICPESIMLNKNGAWKLAGFDFCLLNTNPSEQAPMYQFIEWDSNIPPVAQCNLDYLAPEYTLTMTCSSASDMYSLGVLIYSIFNHGKSLFECQGQLSTFQKNAEELRHLRSTLLGCIPDELRDYVKLMLNIEPSVRPAPEQITKVSFFGDVGSMTLQYLDTLFQRENLEKSQFFKGLPKIIAKFPVRVNQQRILPALYTECNNNNMIPFVLPTILLVAEQSTDKDYVGLILPQLIPMFAIKDPMQVSLIFLQNMNLLLSKTPQTDIRSHVLPMINQALESDNSQIQELCLNIIPTFAELIEYTSLKNSVIPRIKKLALKTSVLAVRVNCLLCLGQMLEHMDKWFVIDDILPLLPTIPTREPAVLMGILGIYRVAFSHDKLGLTKDVMSNKILPNLIPVAMDNNLNLQQFNGYMALIKEMLQKIETEQRTKLEQLDQMKLEQKSIEITKISTTIENEKNLVSVGESNKPKTMMDQFLSGFGMTSLLSGQTTKQTPSVNGNTGSSPQPVRSVTTTPSTVTPQKVTTLSLEEKQRLAKSQDDHLKFKSQKPLSLSPSAGSPQPNTPKTMSTGQTRDLTSSLINSNLQKMNSPTSSYGVASHGNNSFMGSNSSQYMGHNSNTMMGGNSYIGSSGVNSMNGPRPTASKSVDLSAFDNLLSNKNTSKKSLNEMKGSQSAQSFTQSPGMGMMGMPRMGMMGNQGMMRYQPGFNQSYGQQQQFGQSPMMGGNQMPFGQPSNMMTSQQTMGGNFMMPQNQTTNKPNNSNNTDLADIFG